MNAVHAKRELHALTVNGQAFRVHFSEPAQEALVDLAIGAWIAGSGWVTGETFRFMRHALKMPAAKLGALLGVAASTISRWENNERTPTRSTWLALGGLVRERIGIHGRTEQRLEACVTPIERSEQPIELLLNGRRGLLLMSEHELLLMSEHAW